MVMHVSHMTLRHFNIVGRGGAFTTFSLPSQKYSLHILKHSEVIQEHFSVDSMQNGQILYVNTGWGGVRGKGLTQMRKYCHNRIQQPKKPSNACITHDTSAFQYFGGRGDPNLASSHILGQANWFNKSGAQMNRIIQLRKLEVVRTSQVEYRFWPNDEVLPQI